MAEFLIICTGIMVSFLLNEWRQRGDLEEKKELLIVEINKDLLKDSLILESTVKYYRDMLRSHDSLLLNLDKELDKDSLNIYVDHLISYIPFKETKVSYFKVLNDPELVLEEEDTLIERFMILRNLVYPSVHEWLEVEKSFVLEQLLPFMDENAPFIYPTPPQRSFDGSVFYDLRKSSHFMNMIKSGRLYKEYIIKICEQTLANLSLFKNQISAYQKEIGREER